MLKPKLYVIKKDLKRALLIFPRNERKFILFSRWGKNCFFPIIWIYFYSGKMNMSRRCIKKRIILLVQVMIFLKNTFFSIILAAHWSLVSHMVYYRRRRINRILFTYTNWYPIKNVFRAMSRWIAMWSITTKCGIVVFPREKWFFDVDRHATSWLIEIVVRNEKIESTKKHSDHWKRGQDFIRYRQVHFTIIRIVII